MPVACADDTPSRCASRSAAEFRLALGFGKQPY